MGCPLFNSISRTSTDGGARCAWRTTVTASDRRPAHWPRFLRGAVTRRGKAAGLPWAPQGRHWV